MGGLGKVSCDGDYGWRRGEEVATIVSGCSAMRLIVVGPITKM